MLAVVVPASVVSVPSITHVSVGSIFGVGLGSKTVHYNVCLQGFYSWILTLPIAATFGGLIYGMLLRNLV